MDTLLFIETKDRKRKFYGITPAKEDEFLKLFNELGGNVELRGSGKVEEKRVIDYDSKDIKYALSLLVISIVLSISGFVYFLITYYQLPQTIPLHFSLNFTPDRYGDKQELLGVFIILILFGIGFASLLYYYIHKRTHLDQTKYGYSVMILPFLLNLTILIMTIVILNATQAFI